MISQFIINDPDRGISFLSMLKELLLKASALDIAVSYVQISGWVLIEQLIDKMDPKKIRLLITDQFAITHPEALRKALERGIQVRSYVGNRIYHPKVYLVYDATGQPSSAIIGSANMSESGLKIGVEAGVVLSNARLLKKLKNWFEQLFEDDQYTPPLDNILLEKLTLIWNQTAVKRVEIQRIRRKNLPQPLSVPDPSPGDVDILEDLFSTIRLPIGILSIDHAGNNIRNLKRLLVVLKRYPKITNKGRSELYLLGFMEKERDELTTLGSSAKRYRTEKALAEGWCDWVFNQEESELKKLNPRIASFRQAASQFWKLSSEVRTFFFDNLQSRRHRKVLQTIELLCNGSDVVHELMLSDFESLAPVILKVRQLPTFLQRPILDYQENKVSRSWSGDDRKTILTAWRTVTKGKQLKT